MSNFAALPRGKEEAPMAARNLLLKRVEGESDMCGIVGILGRRPVSGDLIESLRRLEYRGYDSAGIATLEGGQLTRRRAEGRLSNLEVLLSQSPLSGAIGIGHTR